jgi:Protein of unknown function (DUF3455)
VPSPNYTTSHACPVPRGSKAYRTTGSPSRPICSRSGFSHPAPPRCFTPFLTIHLQVIQGGLDSTFLFASDHYFIANGTGISPKFASARDGGASFTIDAKVAGLHAPNATNVDWLQLTNVQGTYARCSSGSLRRIELGVNMHVFIGTFAKTVFRVDTKAGQPPASVSHPPFVSARQHS